MSVTALAINIRREYASFRQSDLGGRQRGEPLREREDNEADQRHGAEVNFNINSV